MDYQGLMDKVDCQTVDRQQLGKSLRPMVATDSPLVQVLAMVRKHAAEVVGQLAVAQLGTEAERHEAVRKQGMAQGLQTAVEMILAPIKEISSVEK